MSTARKYVVLGFRNAFTPIQVKITKSLGQISSEIFEKRRVLIEQEKDRRKTSTNKKWRTRKQPKYQGINSKYSK